MGHLHILLATTGYPPEHSGSGGRLHQTYSRLATHEPAFSWSVLTKRRDATVSAPDGPRRLKAFIRGGGEQPGAREAAAELMWAQREVPPMLDSADLIHCAGWSFTTLTLAWHARRRGIPFIRELTTAADVGGGHLGGRLIRWTNRRADALIAISPALEKGVKPDISPSTPLWCRPNGADVRRFHQPEPAARVRLRSALRQYLPELRDDDILVIHVGRIRPLKNQLFLANCIARLSERFHLLLIGPGFPIDDGYTEELRQRLAQPDLAKRAALIEGRHPQVEQFMQAADVFAFPSTAEGLGTVMIEALCCGLPVVASRLPGVTDWIVSEGQNGYLAALDLETFSTRIKAAAQLVRDKPRIAAQAAARFDSTAIDQGYRDLFERLLAPRADAVRRYG